MEHEFDQETICYFLAPNDERYYTVLIGWSQEELMIALMQKEPATETIYVRSQVRENTFLAVFDSAVFLLEHEKNEALAYAGDDGVSFPSGNGP